MESGEKLDTLNHQESLKIEQVSPEFLFFNSQNGLLRAMINNSTHFLFNDF